MEPDAANTVDRTRQRMRKTALAITCVIMLAGVAACGKKGPPQPPNPEQSTYPKTYPAPE